MLGTLETTEESREVVGAGCHAYIYSSYLDPVLCRHCWSFRFHYVRQMEPIKLSLVLCGGHVSLCGLPQSIPRCSYQFSSPLVVLLRHWLATEASYTGPFLHQSRFQLASILLQANSYMIWAKPNGCSLFEDYT